MAGAAGDADRAADRLLSGRGRASRLLRAQPLERLLPGNRRAEGRQIPQGVQGPAEAAGRRIAAHFAREPRSRPAARSLRARADNAATTTSPLNAVMSTATSGRSRLASAPISRIPSGPMPMHTVSSPIRRDRT